ncbi:Na+/H+ antiporter subunit E [Alloalcanivorax venustensis]|jgi:multicomponent K+:H+ antiporter subunit E|uniref:Na+/H+ antiporter subunit E n=1 Tax=Alloalcanivorax venustensis TaxID=172371 RepID=UPI000E87A946|nr:Na+/H+ antiporter subunit E [Alcanivorax sp.]HAR59434.1 Na+/H+ antiporter subunit E [Alcanivorax sp.]HCR79245.1 Na+/H+ antiporter subunit E [Alcanivorax sp.]|tara:strand:+ start:38284 stop:38769 length:486 start_codon:yes stop_codon:yes gene_type:complete
MSRVLPFPLLSLFLWATWMLLNGFSWGHALLGLVLAVVLPLGTQSFWPNVPRLRNFPKLVRFVLVVHWDILTANMAVAVLILGPPRRLRPGFVELPLDLTDEFAITLLASTISLTPGTVSADVSEDRRTLLIHALDVDDQDAMIRQIKQRYERPLKEIFEC